LLPYAQQIADGARRFRDLARTMGDVRSKTVRLGASVPLMQIPRLHALNGEFALRYPQFALKVESGDAETLLTELRRGALDLVVSLTSPGAEMADLAALDVGPLTPFLLAPKGAGVRLEAASLAGRVLAAPRTLTDPALLAQLVEPLRAMGAVVRPAPEPSREALEHLARSHGLAVLMTDGEPLDYEDDPLLVAMPLPSAGAKRQLLRAAGRGLGRAAERYWTLVGSAASEAEPHPAAPA